MTVKASPANSNRDPVVEPNKPRLLRVLGPGLITGAADDDPSGIATYAQTGAQFGYATTWTMPYCYPLMAVVQTISARLGRTTGRGIAGNPQLLSGLDGLGYSRVSLLLAATGALPARRVALAAID